jgi:tetratricopeptide (TPR) repeat protein
MVFQKLRELRELYKELGDRLKFCIERGEPVIAGLVSLAPPLLQGTPSELSISFLTLIFNTFYNILSKKMMKKDITKEIKELKRNENEFKATLSQILDILTDPKLATKDDIGWVKKVIEEIKYIQENILKEINISIDDAIKRAEENISKIRSYISSGLTLLTDSDLTDDLAKKQFKNWYENGYPFGFAAVYHDKDYRRSIVDEVKRKLEENGKAVIVGESGTSKSTIWMRVICEYYKEGYVVLYNKGSKIDYSIAMQYISSLDGNILIAVDNAHTPDTTAIYRLMYENTDESKNIKYLITVREPDFWRFLDHLTSYNIIDEPTRECIYRFEKELDSIKIQTTYFTKDEIKEFFQVYEKLFDYNTINQIYNDTKGHPLLIRFFLTGNGLIEDVRKRHSDYITRDDNKIKAMLVCTLLDLASNPISDEEVKRMDIDDDFFGLEKSVIYYDNDNRVWRSIHRLWAIEWLSYLFSSEIKRRDRSIFMRYVRCLENTLMEVKEKLGENRLADMISGLLKILEAGKINIDFISNDIKIDKYIDVLSEQNKGKIYLLEGQILNDFENYERAIKCFDRISQSDPNFVYGLVYKGYVLTKMKRYEEAIEYFDRALAIKPNDVDALSCKGHLLNNKRRYKEARRHLYEAFKIDPNYVYVWANLGYNHLGASHKTERYKRYKQYKYALVYFDIALMLRPHFAYALKGKGYVLKEYGRYEEAIEYFDRALAIKPNDVDALKGKGYVLKEYGRYEEAIEYFDRALAIKPNDVDALKEKADILSNMMKYEKAIECLLKAVSLYIIDYKIHNSINLLIQLQTQMIKYITDEEIKKDVTIMIKILFYLTGELSREKCINEIKNLTGSNRREALIRAVSNNENMRIDTNDIIDRAFNVLKKHILKKQKQIMSK